MSLEDAAPPVTDYPLRLSSGETLRATVLGVGNPHCVVFVEEFDRLDWRQVGEEIERHDLFPERTNVEFVRVRDEENIELRIWERGVGETHSSGTCASAAAIACALTGRCGRQVGVRTPGGGLTVEWRDGDDVVVLTGRAEIVYEGVWLRGIHDSA